MTHPELPHNIEAEKATLGSILLNREAIVAVAPWLLPSYFYMERHAQLYEAMLACYNARIPPDTRTVSEELRRRNQLDAVGGIMYLSALVDTVPTSYHVEYYARIIERTALLRQLISAGGKIAALGYNEQDELEDTLDKAEQTLFDVSQRRSTQDFVPISQVIDSYYEQINYLQEHRGEVVGVPTGFRDLDEITGGLQQSDLIILAARPSVGKTSLVLSLAYNVATRHQRTVGIFSLEMSRDQLVQRLISMDTRIDTHRLRTGHVGEAELQVVMDSMGRLAAVPIYIEDTPGLSIMEVRSKARRLQSQAGVDLIIIDYLQLMAGRRTENRVQEVSEISRGLTALARELNVPVIALSQLAYLIGDGCTLPRQPIHYTTNDSILAETVARLASEVFGDAVNPRISKERQWYQVYLAAGYQLTHGIRNPVAKWLDKLGVFGLRSYEKRVPQKVFMQPASSIACFLRHLWATDGCVHLSKGKINSVKVYYATSSPELACNIQSLLLRLGLNASVLRYEQKGKGRDQYHVKVSGKPDVETFFENIGVLGQKKIDHQSAINEYFASSIAKTNRDVLPVDLWNAALINEAGHSKTSRKF